MKALERQVGADLVDLDTDQQWATIYYLTPKPIDFAGTVKAADNAAVPTLALIVHVQGTIEELACDDCAESRQFLRLESGQALELSDTKYQVGEDLSLRATVDGWSGKHPVLKPIQ